MFGTDSAICFVDVRILAVLDGIEYNCTIQTGFAVEGLAVDAKGGHVYYYSDNRIYHNSMETSIGEQIANSTAQITGMQYT